MIELISGIFQQSFHCAAKSVSGTMLGESLSREGRGQGSCKALFALKLPVCTLGRGVLSITHLC